MTDTEIARLRQEHGEMRSLLVRVTGGDDPKELLDILNKLPLIIREQRDPEARAYMQTRLEVAEALTRIKRQ